MMTLARRMWTRAGLPALIAVCLTLALAGFASAAPRTSGESAKMILGSPNVIECQYTHWGGFESAETDGNGYRVIAIAEGQYDNHDNAFCGGVRGHLQVWIPAFHVGGSTYVSFSYNNMHNSSSAGNAGSSGYWYNLYTSTTYSVSCGSAYGSFTPSGGSLMIASTYSGCA